MEVPVLVLILSLLCNISTNVRNLFETFIWTIKLVPVKPTLRSVCAFQAKKHQRVVLCKVQQVAPESESGTEP